ncbi:MAG: MFS transporter [Bryobacteraceae bacterium]
MTSPAAYLNLLRRNANFRRLWLAQIVSEIGDWFYSLAIYSLILELTGRAELQALAVVVQVLPQTLIAPMAGVVNDRLSRRSVMIAADVARVLIVLGMLFVRSRETVWLIYPLLLLETFCVAFFEPGRNAVIPSIVEEDEVLAANALSAATWSFNLAVGATLGGVVAVALGRDAVFILNAFSFLLSALLLRRMHFNEPHVDPAPLRLAELFNYTPILEGIRYIKRDSRLLATVMVKGGLGFLGANLVLLPVLGERVFAVQAGGLDPKRGEMLAMSLLMGSRGIGALLAPFLTSPWARSDPKRLRIGILAGFLAAPIAYVILSRAPSLGIACLALVLAHGGGSTIWVFSSTLLQLQTEDRFRGRVFAAELGMNTLTVSIFCYLIARVIDAGVPVRDVTLFAGLSLLIPATVWWLALRLWR